MGSLMDKVPSFPLVKFGSGRIKPSAIFCELERKTEATESRRSLAELLNQCNGYCSLPPVRIETKHELAYKSLGPISTLSGTPLISQS